MIQFWICEVSLGMIHSASGTGSENKESSNGRNEEETVEQILRYDKSAAGICCQLQARPGTQITHTPMMKDVIGIVVCLGRLKTIISAGFSPMLAVVCKTHDAVQALETYDHRGCINKNSGLHQLGASIGKPLHGRHVVSCLENLRPYAGEFIADDPQRRLVIEKPRYLNEETPGFLGFAVNMVNIDTANLYGVTSTCHGLRETLFYTLFSRLQVYKTRADMLQALPLITDGAVSLDGGIIKSHGVSVLGKREVEINLPKRSRRSTLPENYFDTKRRMKELEWKRTRFVGDLQREEILLEHAKVIFEIKKQEFVKFLAHSSSYARTEMTRFGRGRGGKGRERGNVNGRPDNCGTSNLNVNTSLTHILNQLSLPHSRSIAIHEPIQRTSTDTQLSRNMEESEHPSPMNINSGGASSNTTKKRGRGRYKSIQVDMKTKYGGKITVDIPDEIERAVGDGVRDIANYCGLIMRTTVSFSDGNWAAISAKHGQTMWLKVKDKFEVGRGRQENVLQAFVISTTQRLFRTWKTRLHNEYKRYKTDAERLSNKPEDVSPADWEYLIQHFKSSKFQAASARNKLNRAKQIMKHSCGSKSFAEVEESTRDPQTGEKATADKIWELQHTRKKDKGELLWSDQQSQ